VLPVDSIAQEFKGGLLNALLSWANWLPLGMKNAVFGFLY